MTTTEAGKTVGRIRAEVGASPEGALAR